MTGLRNAIYLLFKAEYLHITVVVGGHFGNKVLTVWSASEYEWTFSFSPKVRKIYVRNTWGAWKVGPRQVPRSPPLKPIAECTSGVSKPSVWGGAVKLGGAKVFTCLNTKVCLRQSLGVTQKWLPFVGQKWLVLLVELCDLSGKNHSWKRFTSLIHKRFEKGPKQ